MKKQILSTLIFLLGMTFTMSAQTSTSPWGIGISYGKMQYSGDKGDNFIFGSPNKTQFGARVSKYMSPLFDLGLGVTFGDIGLEDFNASMWQANLNGQVKIIQDKKFTPFVSLQVGYASFSADVNSADDSGLYYGAGFGLRYHIADAINIFYHGQYDLYTGDDFDGSTADDSNDKFLLHEFGIGFNLGKQDMDDDGVADKKDLCPNTPGLKEFDGCPDSDLDGIVDADDACPNDAGLAEFNGCPDTDGDGIIDGEDKCPQVAGDAMYQGCPDTDGDGIGDGDDECPEESGVSKYNGCPVPDTDGDGFDDDNDNCINTAGPANGCPDKDGDTVADKDDKCPDTPGAVNAAGCPDKDGDGVGDAFDECPDEAGLPELDGCPKVRKPTKEEIINSYASPMIHFKYGLVPEDDYDAKIAEIVEFANEYPEAYLNVGGYSDSQGSEASNMVISRKRARKVYNSLKKAGIDADRMYYEGYGESNPVADNDTAEGRKMNRRVVVTGSTVKREVDTTNTKR